MTTSMTKSQFANSIYVSVKTLQRYMNSYDEEIQAIDPIYKNRKLLIPSVVDFLKEKYCRKIEREIL